MAFVNLSLLAGGLLIAVPIVLHLMLRQQPKPLVFPAIRFVKQRHESNRRQLQLRHWLLLALRCFALLTLVLALSRPSVGSAQLGSWLLVGLVGGLTLLAAALLAVVVVTRRGKTLVVTLALLTALLASGLGVMVWIALQRGPSRLLGDEQAPVAAVIVVDVAPRMQYRHENRTRLEAAQEMARWLLSQLPADSEIAVLDTRRPIVLDGVPARSGAFAADRAAARKAIDSLQPTGVPERLPDVLDEALALVAASERARKEIYVLTDLARGAWESPTAARLKSRLAEARDVLPYLIDVGVPAPRNHALGDVALSAETLARGSALTVQTDVRQTGPGGTHPVELYLEDPDLTRPVIRDGRTLVPTARLRSRELCELPEDGAQRVQFRLGGLELGTHQGFLRIVGDDSLAFDNVRYFTIDVRPAWPVLVVAPAGVVTKFLTEALAPYELRATNQARFDCTVVPQASLADQRLTDYSAVCLLDPEPLPPAQIEQLAGYVRAGGGLAWFLGHNAVPKNLQDPVAQELLGARLARMWRAGADDLFLAPASYDHPVLAEFRPMATSVPWQRFPVYRHWVVEDLARETRVVMAYGNEKPALLERPLGAGRVLVLTTPVSDAAESGREPWNELPIGENAWPYFVLVNEMAGYVVGSQSTRLNYFAGESASLRNDARQPARYELFTPLDEVQEVVARDGQVRFRATDVPGAYRLKGHSGTPIVRGFCANVRSEESDLTRLAPEQLDDLLGARRYKLARDRDDITQEVGEARVGREFYPFLMLMLALVLAVEHLLANRFYRAT